MLLKALSAVHIQHSYLEPDRQSSIVQRNMASQFLNVFRKGFDPYMARFRPSLLMCEVVKPVETTEIGSSLNATVERFMDLVRTNESERLRELMRGGFDLRQTDSESWNCLHWATEMGHQKLVLMFLDHDPLLLNMKTKEGLSPINIAAWRGDHSMVELLLAQGAEIDDRTKWGEVPLHHAVTFGHIRVCEILLKHGADAFAEDKLKRTPYMIAMQKGSDKMKAVFAKYNKA